MYAERLKLLKRAYSRAERENNLYQECVAQIAELKRKKEYIESLMIATKNLNTVIAKEEQVWREAVLRFLEAEIAEYLDFVYPNDGYCVQLSTRLLRGKLTVEASVRSYCSGVIPGSVSDSQGRLFQQIVSFAALLGIMKILGVNTVYIDEAFSGCSKGNMMQVNAILERVRAKGFNLVLIAQDSTLAQNIAGNILLLERTLDNKTIVR